MYPAQPRIQGIERRKHKINNIPDPSKTPPRFRTLPVYGEYSSLVSDDNDNNDDNLDDDSLFDSDSDYGSEDDDNGMKNSQNYTFSDDSEDSNSSDSDAYHDDEIEEQSSQKRTILHQQQQGITWHRILKFIIIFALIVGITVTIWVYFRKLKSVIKKLLKHRHAGYFILWITFVSQSLLCLPTLPLTLAAGFAYGTKIGCLIITCCSLSGVCCGFLVSRYLLRGYLRKRLLAIDDEKDAKDAKRKKRMKKRKMRQRWLHRQSFGSHQQDLASFRLKFQKESGDFTEGDCMLPSGPTSPLDTDNNNITNSHSEHTKVFSRHNDQVPPSDDEMNVLSLNFSDVDVQFPFTLSNEHRHGAFGGAAELKINVDASEVKPGPLFIYNNQRSDNDSENQHPNDHHKGQKVFVTPSTATDTPDVAREEEPTKQEETTKSSSFWRNIDQVIADDGFTITFLLRFSPLHPYGLFNYLFGLTSVSFTHYILASAFSMFPTTLMEVYLGSALKNAKEILNISQKNRPIVAPRDRDGINNATAPLLPIFDDEEDSSDYTGIDPENLKTHRYNNNLPSAEHDEIKNGRETVVFWCGLIFTLISAALLTIYIRKTLNSKIQQIQEQQRMKEEYKKAQRAKLKFKRQQQKVQQRNRQSIEPSHSTNRIQHENNQEFNAFHSD